MYFKWQKLLVLTISFFGLFFSAYGFAFLSNLRDAVLSAESLVGNIFKNIVQVAQQFRTYTDVFDAAVEEHCIFRCPNGKFSPSIFSFQFGLFVYLKLDYFLRHEN